MTSSTATTRAASPAARLAGLGVGLAALIAAPAAAQSGPPQVSAFGASFVVDAGRAPARPYADWFSLTDETRRDWNVEMVDGDPFHLSIRNRRADDRARTRTSEPYEIFVLYPRRSSAYDTALSKILSVFGGRGVDANFTAVNFNRDPSRGAAAVDGAERAQVDLIFGMGSESTAWLWENRRDSDIPIVSVTSKDPVVLGQAAGYNLGSGVNFAFTSLNMPVEAQLAYVEQLRPNLRNLAVLVDSKNISAVETQARPIIELAAARGVRTLSLEVQNPENAREELVDLVSDAVNTMRLNDVNLDNSLFWITGSTSVFREIETINRHSDRVPVLSVVPEVVQPGEASAALSIGISFESNAHLASIYAIKVLEGDADISELPVGVVSPPDIAINFLRARDIGLRIPFNFLEGASFIYDYDGEPVRRRGFE